MIDIAFVTKAALLTSGEAVRFLLPEAGAKGHEKNTPCFTVLSFGLV